MALELEGKVVMITGAAGALGQATARVLLEEGCSLVLTDRDPRPLEAAADTLGAGERILARPAELTDESQVRQVVAAGLERFGRVDGLHANAGINGASGPLLELPPSAVLEAFEVNVLGVLHSVRACAEPLKAAPGGGAIVVTASAASHNAGEPWLGPYVTSKHAVLGLVRVLAHELGPVGVRVNAVAPGSIDSPMNDTWAATRSTDDPLEHLVAFVPARRLGRPPEVAQVVAFLLSARASYVHGSSYAVDGGLMA